MKVTIKRQAMKRQLAVIGAAVLVAATSVVLLGQPASAATGLHISGTNIVEANGQPLVMRGINHEHVWFTGQTSSFANIKATGANTVRVVLGSGKRWGPSTDIANVILLCKQNRLICVLEVHDTTGYGEDGAAATLDEAVTYWISQKAALVGQENYVVINIGNEPIGNTNPAQWTSATAAAIQRMRSNGFEHLLMVDAPNWGQDWQNVMRDNGQTVLNADTNRNTVLSVHMYAVYSSAATIIDYLNRFQTNGWPLVIGEFGWKFAASEVDDQTLLSEAARRGIGYIGWSWAGNNDPILDMTNNFDPNQLTTWGQRIVNGANGIRATSREASIYSGVTPTATTTRPPTSRPPTSAPPTSAPPTSRPPTSRPPTSTPPTSRPPTTTAPGGSRTCTATYSVLGQWSGGFQGDIRVTAGSAAISGWTVTWTFANGQTVTQSWSATVTSSGSSVTARNVSYNGGLAAGAGTTFGFLGSWNGTNSAPTLSCAAS
jgi:mannan endo-1,4-beta-mannosidase